MRDHAAVLTSCFVALGAASLIALSNSQKPFYYDSSVYWILQYSFFKHGQFSLLNFTSPLRGYLLPLIYYALREVSDAVSLSPSHAVKLFNVLMFALIGAVLAPRLAEITWPRFRWGIGRRLALTALLLAFWSGYLEFPLSDFPALAMALLALIAVDRSDSLVWTLLAGVACGVAIDMRPQYLPLALILLLFVIVPRLARRESAARSLKQILPRFASLAIGLVLISLPQSLSAHRHFHTWSFVPGAAAHLSSLQLTEGLRLQRYETYVGLGHGPRMEYRDEAGSRLLAKQKDGHVASVGQYLGLIASHPVTMAPLFVRHLVNGFDQRYTTPYVGHLDTGSHRWLRLGGFLLVFLALLRIFWSGARRSIAPSRWRYPIALAACAVTSVPSAVETRYMLPVWLLVFVLALLPAWPNPVGAGTGVTRYRSVVGLAFSYLLFTAAMFYIASNASSHLHLV